MSQPSRVPSPPASLRGLLTLLASAVFLCGHAQAQVQAQAQAQPAARAFTLEQVLAAPFPSGLTAASGPAGRVAWASLEQGRRSIWVAEPTGQGAAASVRARRVANFADDDGQDLGGIALSRDGQVIAFVRGQGLNRNREFPNPSSDPAGAEQAVWVSARGGAARRVGVGSNPAVSPGGQFVVYQRDSTLMIAPTDGSAQPRPLFRARGISRGHEWSPDGRLIAFTSFRGTHAFIGIYDRGGDSIRWIAPSIDRDGSPRWSPDGRQLAFIRTPGDGPGRVALMVADVASGEARELWRTPAGMRGRLRSPTAGESFMWAGGHLVFFMEMDGWQHLYAFPASGGSVEPVQLTRGSCEVEEPTVTPDGGWIYFSNNCGNIDLKRISRVRTAGGGEPEVVTAPDEIAWSPVVAGSSVVFLRADARRPAAPFWRPVGAGADVAARPVAGAPTVAANFPLDALVEPQAVTFRTDDGTEIRGQLFVPPNARNAPAIVFTHGGPVRQMLLGWHPRGYYTRMYALNQYLASRGFVVLSVNYRGGVGYGREFREAPRRGRAGGSEYQDIVAAARFLQQHPAVDGERIGKYGGSYGGYLTALAMGRNPELFKAGVDIHGVHDWNARALIFGATVPFPGTREDSVFQVGTAASPICCVDNIRGPLLLIHGDDDRNVEFSETVNFAHLLRRGGKPHEVIVFPDDVHDFLRYRNWLIAARATADFFERTLVRGETVSVGGRQR